MFQLMFAVITPGADLGCRAGAHQVLELGHLRRPLGDDRVLPGRPLGVRVRRLRGREGRLDRQQPQGARLRRWDRGPHQRRCGGPRPRARARQAPRLAARPGPSALAAVRAPRREPAVVRLVRLQRRLGPGRQLDRRDRLHDDHRGHRRGDHRLADRRAGPRRQADHARCRLGCRRRPRRDHPGLCVRQPGRRSRDRRHRRCGLRALRVDQVPARASTTRSTSSRSTSSVV